jgi:hypothetical protein
MPRKPKYPPKVEWDAYWALMDRLQGIDGLGAAMPIPRPLPPEDAPAMGLQGSEMPIQQYPAPMQRPEAPVSRGSGDDVQYPSYRDRYLEMLSDPFREGPVNLPQSIADPAIRRGIEMPPSNPSDFDDLFAEPSAEWLEARKRTEDARNAARQPRQVSPAELMRLQKIHEQRARARQ